MDEIRVILTIMIKPCSAFHQEASNDGVNVGRNRIHNSEFDERRFYQSNCFALTSNELFNGAFGKNTFAYQVAFL
ncbi:MAG: hypothetical protein M3367_08800 [Acidobacteriota bacterium]|nr:hypothetical protein [Acidobacteriota bacterium]